MSEPKSLQQAILYFSNPDNCTQYLAVRRWPNGVICPGCGSERVSYNANRRTWKCSTHHPKREFSVKVGTIFEDSPIPLDKWLAATWMLTNCKNGISSYEVGRALKVTQRTAWFMLHRIRLALQGNSKIKLGGPGTEVEVDETFIGGKARNMHLRSAQRRRVDATGVGGKTPVVGILERDGEVRAGVIPTRRKNVLHGEIDKHVAPGSVVYTDALMSYLGLPSDYEHKVIDHAERYVDGTFTPTDSKTSGRCSSADSREPTLASNRSICSATSTNKYFGTTIAPPKRIRWMTATALMPWCAALLASASLGTISPEKLPT